MISKRFIRVLASILALPTVFILFVIWYRFQVPDNNLYAWQFQKCYERAADKSVPLRMLTEDAKASGGFIDSSIQAYLKTRLQKVGQNDKELKDLVLFMRTFAGWTPLPIKELTSSDREKVCEVLIRQMDEVQGHEAMSSFALLEMLRSKEYIVKAVFVHVEKNIEYWFLPDTNIISDATWYVNNAITILKPLYVAWWQKTDNWEAKCTRDPLLDSGFRFDKSGG